ncbi:MAG: GDP-mannose 4,6-dehydratase [Candidatus Abawacabacteria bacterium]|nr:GDP-mannose 4,6-dehydratase [Candidatus Abawacabacteria bacterium]
MKVLVTGATGFVGTYLVDFLKKNGHQVWGIGRRSTNQVGVYLGDITDKDFVSQTIRTIKPELVFHLAGYSLVKTSFQEPELVRKINVEGTINLLDVLQETVPLARFLYVSSAVVYGAPSKTPITELQETRPSSPYAQSRVDTEKALLNYQVPWMIARSFNHTGPGQTNEYVLSDWCRQAAAIELGMQPPMIRVGNVESVRDFLDVRDIVKIYYELLLKGEMYQTYNVGSGTGYRLGDLLNRILSFINVPVAVVIDNDKVRLQDTTLLVADISKTSNILKLYSSEYSIEQTLKDILEYWRRSLRINPTS